MPSPISGIGTSLQEASLLQAVDDAHHLAAVDVESIADVLLRHPIGAVEAGQDANAAQAKAFVSQRALQPRSQRAVQLVQRICKRRPSPDSATGCVWHVGNGTDGGTPQSLYFGIVGIVRYLGKGVSGVATFTDKEVEYLRGQRLGRLATVGGDGSPHVVPVGFRLAADGKAIEVGGHGLGGSKKWRDLQANPRIAIVVDDLVSTQPWTPRGIEIRGRAELQHEGGTERFGGGGWDSVWIRILPRRVVSWGIEGPSFSREGHSARTAGGSTS